jgi:hypothetical protein
MGNPANILAAIHATTTTRQAASNAGTRSFNPSSVPVPAAIAIAQSTASSPQRIPVQEVRNEAPVTKTRWTVFPLSPVALIG